MHADGDPMTATAEGAPPGADRLNLLTAMLRIRMVEERIAALYPSDRIQSPVHMSIGQEAAAVGLCAHLRPTDLLFTTYRGHAHYLAKGGDLKAMLAELYGRATGFAKGKAGSMHLAAPSVGMMGSSAIVASTIPHAVGAAMKSRWQSSDDITVCVFGDGATEEGVYHESLNFAAVQQLPVLFLCENNGLAIHARLADRQAYDLMEHAAVYGIPAHRLNTAYDPSTVYRQLAPIIAGMRDDRCPRFVELPLFRAREHVGPGEDFHRGYRSRHQLAEWQLNDPLLAPLDGDDGALAEARAAIAAEIDAAVAFAEASPAPDPREVLTDVDRCFG
jgi:TPP-dependent pyruvate/acetoin dehydrogenase alpha subunit